MSATSDGEPSTPIQRKAISQSSSAVCGASISTAKRSICIAILAEYDFRYNHRIALGFNDGERAALAVKNAAGKRLTYRGTNEAEALERKRSGSCAGGRRQCHDMSAIAAAVSALNRANGCMRKSV